MEWKQYKLVELGSLGRGKSKHRPRDAKHLYGGPYPFIQTGDVKNANHKVYSYSQSYSEAGLAQSKLWPKGTLCITIAANIADTAILTFPACFPDSVLGFVANPELCDAEFIEYLLQFYQKQIQKHSIGSVQENINLGTFQNISFQIPDLPTQHRIASILSALDNKIELNRQMNQTLEQMAQTLFRQYFVEPLTLVNQAESALRPSEHEKQPLGSLAAEEAFTPANRAENGITLQEAKNLPSGWKIGKLGEICQNFDNKRIPLSSRQRAERKGPYPYYGAAALMDYVDDFIFNGTYILLGEDGTVVDSLGYPALQYVWGKFWVNNHAHVLQGKSYFSTNYLYMLLRNTQVAHLVTGAAQPKINQGNLNNLAIVIPDEVSCQKFDHATEFLFEKIKSNILENQTLTQTRDTLLPKLMSGEINVLQAAKTGAYDPEQVLS